MDARVTFSRETRQKLANPGLSSENKRRLRIGRVLEFIDHQPAGQPIAHADVIAAAGFDVKSPNEYAKGRYLIQWLIKDCTIEHDGKRNARKAHYKIKKTTPEAVRTAHNNGYSLSQLEKDAKEFVWSTGSDSLRDFVQSKLNKEISNG